MDPRLIRIATSHFDELQGLRTVAIGMTLALVAFVDSMPAADPIDGVLREIVNLVPMFFVLWASHALPAYYACSTGRAVRRRASLAALYASTFWIMWAVTPFSARGWQVAIWVVWALHPLYVVWSAWPYRAHHLLSFGASLWILWLRVTGPPMHGPLDWASQMYVLAFAVVVTGLADHLVLMRALPGAFRLKAEATESE